MKPLEQHRSDHAQVQRLQIGAALVLAVLILLGIVLRALHGNVLPAGWWHL